MVGKTKMIRKIARKYMIEIREGSPRVNEAMKEKVAKKRDKNKKKNRE